MLEDEYQARGPAAQFTTTNFSFNLAHGTVYELDFGAMTQTNTESRTVRRIQRTGSAVAPPPKWRCYLSGAYTPYDADISAQIEAAFQADAQGSVSIMVRGQAYTIDFKTMKQILISDPERARKVDRDPPPPPPPPPPSGSVWQEWEAARARELARQTAAKARLEAPLQVLFTECT